MKFYQSLKFKLTFFMLLLLVIPLSIVGYVSYQKTSILEQAVIQKADMENVSKKFKQIFLDHEKFIQEFSLLPELQFHTYDFSNTAKKDITNLPIVNDPAKEGFYQTFFKEFEDQHEFLLNTYLATEKGEFYLFSDRRLPLQGTRRA